MSFSDENVACTCVTYWRSFTRDRTVTYVFIGKCTSRKRYIYLYRIFWNSYDFWLNIAYSSVHIHTRTSNISINVKYVSWKLNKKRIRHFFYYFDSTTVCIYVLQEWALNHFVIPLKWTSPKHILQMPQVFAIWQSVWCKLRSVSAGFGYLHN